MEKESVVRVPQGYGKLAESEFNGKREEDEEEKKTKKKEKMRNWDCWRCHLVLVILIAAIYSVVSIWCLRGEVELLKKKMAIIEKGMDEEVQMWKNWGNLVKDALKNMENGKDDGDVESFFKVKEYINEDNEEDSAYEEDDDEDEDQDDNYGGSREENDGIEDGVKKKIKNKREIREYEISMEKETKNDTEEKPSAGKASMEKTSTETSPLEKSSEFTSRERIVVPSTYRASRKHHPHRKHRKSRIGSSSAERFYTETHSTTSAPIQVRQSRTKSTQSNDFDRKTWLRNQMLQQHRAPNRDTITREEAVLKGYGKDAEDEEQDEAEAEARAGNRGPDALAYNMITIHFSADTSHYSRERDPHYFGNGRMQIKSEVYKDWKPAHWTQGVGMSKYFHLHQGRVTVSTTGIYLIYAQIQYSNVQEVNGFGVFRNNEVVVQCITTSTHPDKQEIKSNTCGISTTILLQSNDSVCIKDLHHGRYVVLTPEKSYFGLVLLSPFKK